MLHEKTARALSNFVSPSIEIVEVGEHDLAESHSSPSDTTVCEDSIGDPSAGQITALDSPIFFSNTSIPNVTAQVVIPCSGEDGPAQSPW